MNIFIIVIIILINQIDAYYFQFLIVIIVNVKSEFKNI